MTLVTLFDAHLAFGDKPLLDGARLTVQADERIGLIGRNGTGKSTLLRLIAARVQLDDGELQRRDGLRIELVEQEPELASAPTLGESLVANVPGERWAFQARLNEYMHRFGLDPTRALATASGGERKRASLTLALTLDPDLLLLDEPTNHLDLETRHALTMALAQFEGTLILVSHDRHLLRATTDQFMLVARHRLQPFDGDLDDYRDWLLQHAAEQRAAAKADSATTPAAGPVVNRKDQKRQEAEQRQRLSHLKKPLQTRIAKLEKEMETLHAQKAQLDAFVADPASYEAARKTELTDAIRTLGDVNSRLETVEADWLATQEELEQIG